MLGRLFLAFTLIPLIDFYLLFRVGEHIGFAATVLIVILTGWLGAVLARREGLRVFLQFQKEIQSGKLPGDTILEGVLVLASGLLLITPGFLTVR
nr:FxsA family protein [bacterium]